MSKKSKAKSKLYRLQEKRKRKAAEKAKYQAFAESGKNTKSYRQAKKAKAGARNRIRHSGGPCGNIGCQRCSPQYPPHPRMDRPLQGYRAGSLV